jgi:hypothetical protein
VGAPVSDDVEEVLAGVEDPQRRADARELVELMRRVTGEEPEIRGTNMIGFGNYHYVYESGREGDTMTVGFAPRKSALVLYGLIFYEERNEKLERLGKHKAGKGCVYIKRLDDVDLDVLETMIREAYEARRQ